jgi:hypothetical protein
MFSINKMNSVIATFEASSLITCGKEFFLSIFICNENLQNLNNQISG